MERRTRAERQRLEHRLLAPEATKSDQSRGREISEDPDPFRTPFERDRDRIVHSNTFRRLKHKTQVFMLPEGDHYVTRLTHTVSVTQIGRSLAVALGLNEVLTEAICLAHDVGHSPFGHTGEDALARFLPEGWLHSEQGVRNLSVLEPRNLSWEVLDGIRAHSWKIDPPPATPEGWLCRFADRIAYLAHDAADAIRSDILVWSDFPTQVRARLGDHGREWINQLITAVIDHSARTGQVGLDPATLEVMHTLREFMFERVYHRPAAEEQRLLAEQVVSFLVEYYRDNRDQIPEAYRDNPDDTLQASIDYVAGMTDRFALSRYRELNLEAESEPLSLLSSRIS